MKHVVYQSPGFEFYNDGRAVTRALLDAAASAVTTVEALARDMLDLTETIHRHDASEARARAILDGAAEAIITMDSRGTIETVNRAAEALFGYTAAELLGRDVELLFWPSDAGLPSGCFQVDVTTWQRPMHRAVREAVGRHKDGTSLPIALSLSEVDFNCRRLITAIVRPREPR